MRKGNFYAKNYPFQGIDHLPITNIRVDDAVVSDA